MSDLLNTEGRAPDVTNYWMEAELSKSSETQTSQQSGDSGVKAYAGTWKDEIERLEKVAPEWYQDFQESDPFIAPKATVQRLIDTAPDAWSRGLIMGIDMFRVQIEAFTCRPYA